MALIKCIECGREISSKALACPHCGCPIEIINNEEKIIEDKVNESFVTTEEKEQKKKRIIPKKILIIGGVVLCIIVGMLAHLSIDYRKYQGAVANYNIQQYDSAITAFTELGDYLESKDYLTKSYYEKGKVLYGERKYDEAAETFKIIIDYSDSQILYNQCIYDKAQKLMDEKAYDEAAEYFAQLGEFKDAKLKNEQCVFEASVDGRFLRDFIEGLSGRWEVSINEETPTDEMEYIEYSNRLINPEYNAINKYEKEQFIDSELRNIYMEYMRGLNAQKKALEYYTANYLKFVNMWNEGSSIRSRCIYLINKKYELKFDDKYSDTFTEVLYSGKAYDQEASVYNKVIEMVSIDKFEKTSSKYGRDVFTAVIENITDVTFSFFNVDVKLYNEDDVIIDTKVCNSIEDFKPGAKAKFSFSTSNEEVVRIETAPNFVIK